METPHPEPEVPTMPDGLRLYDRERWNVKTIRALVKAGMTDEWIAEKMGMSVRTVVRYYGCMKERPRQAMRHDLPKDFKPIVKDRPPSRAMIAGRKNLAHARAVQAERRKRKLMEEQP